MLCRDQKTWQTTRCSRISHHLQFTMCVTSPTRKRLPLTTTTDKLSWQVNKKLKHASLSVNCCVWCLLIVSEPYRTPYVFLDGLVLGWYHVVWPQRYLLTVSLSLVSENDMCSSTNRKSNCGKQCSYCGCPPQIMNMWETLYDVIKTLKNLALAVNPRSLNFCSLKQKKLLWRAQKKEAVRVVNAVWMYHHHHQCEQAGILLWPFLCVVWLEPDVLCSSLPTHTHSHTHKCTQSYQYQSYHLVLCEHVNVANTLINRCSAPSALSLTSLSLFMRSKVSSTSMSFSPGHPASYQ